ncbi:hypothetical protein [Actinomadura rudentiformis]|uniref:Uncharacterized protein n=1 Tax=Actinomadura rudentiformis TaxID=359158 RepID=A0A6H9YGN0_9ACTN|nr:hypothetical protein [Actinomadura rudentiformis]KAB2344844.1 hypothetical protein F8566_30090 [Actinomadura rudentiformis]
MKPTTAAPAARWFPLVERPRPAAMSLATRVADLRHLLEPASDDALVRTAEALNKAALIASDRGQSDLARFLCWQQYQAFDYTRPHPRAIAKLALQPVLNLPRQLIRDGDADAAYALLEVLHHAASNRADITIDGHVVHLHDLTHSAGDHHDLRATVWAALLADGTRALTTAGRWREAADRAAVHRGIGQRLLDGRQITILALLREGDVDQASALVETSTVSAPWECAIQAMLRVMCQRVGAGSQKNVATMVTSVRHLLEQTTRGGTVFRVRAGLIALELADDPHDDQIQRLLTAVLQAAADDAYASRDALTVPALQVHIPVAARRKLVRAVRAADLIPGELPAPLRTEFMANVASALRTLRRILGSGAK